LRLDSPSGRATWRSLTGLALACIAPLACKSPEAPPPRPAPPAWVGQPPTGCAVGFSGPTLHPGDAIRQARTNALEALAAERLGVAVDSELRITAGAVHEVTTQEISGIIANSRIVAMASGTGAGQQAREGLREVYALACPGDTDTHAIARPGFPDWILNIPSEPGRICVAGIGGPTRNPDDQDEAALRDGRDALAHSVESHIRQVTLDDGKGLARVASESESTARARAIADGVTELSEQWRDVRGRGPVGIPGVLYGLLCADL